MVCESLRNDRRIQTFIESTCVLFSLDGPMTSCIHELRLRTYQNSARTLTSMSRVCVDARDKRNNGAITRAVLPSMHRLFHGIIITNLNFSRAIRDCLEFEYTNPWFGKRTAFRTLSRSSHNSISSSVTMDIAVDYTGLRSHVASRDSRGQYPSA